MGDPKLTPPHIISVQNSSEQNTAVQNSFGENTGRDQHNSTSSQLSTEAAKENVIFPSILSASTLRSGRSSSSNAINKNLSSNRDHGTAAKTTSASESVEEYPNFQQVSLVSIQEITTVSTKTTNFSPSSTIPSVAGVASSEEQKQQLPSLQLHTNDDTRVCYSDPSTTKAYLRQKMFEQNDDMICALVSAYEACTYHESCSKCSFCRSGDHNAGGCSCNDRQKKDVESSTRAFLLLSGKSVEKRCITDAALRAVVEDRDGGYYLEGHYDSMKLPIPYSGLVAAFDSFTSRVIQQRGSGVDALRKSILSELNGIGYRNALTSVIPSLNEILGPATCSGSSGDGEQQLDKKAITMATSIQRFVVAFRLFVRAITQDQPLVLVLHDLQFADPCSLDILVAIAVDNPPGRRRRLCLVGTCDHSMVTAESYLARKLREMEDAGVKISNCILQPNMQPGGLARWLRSGLLLDTNNLDHLNTLQRLTQLVTHRVDGCDWFLVMEFIQWLQETDLLCYRNRLESGGRWVLSSAEEIDFVFNCPGSSREACFLVHRLRQQLTEDAKYVLQVCACLGNTVNVGVLKYILEGGMLQELDNLANRNWILSNHAVGDNGSKYVSSYSFEIDAIRQAAYSLITNPELFHLEIGRRLWRNLSSEQLEEHLFVVLSQVFMGRRLVTREKELVAFASLCLHAGRKATKCSTFRTAAVYFKMGIDFLRSDCHVAQGPTRNRCWRDQYDLTLALHCAAAEMCMCCSQFEEMQELLNSILKNARTFDDKVQAYTTKMYSLGNQEQQHACIDLGVEVLRHLGETFPVRTWRVFLLREFMSVDRLLKKLSNEQICRLPQLTDDRKLKAMHVLNFMIHPTLAHRPQLAPFVLLKLTKMTLLHGLSVFAPLAFVTYGMVCIGASYDVDNAARYGELGLRLLEHLAVTEYLPRAFMGWYGCISVFCNPIQISLKPLLHAYRVGMSTGDLEYSGLCAYNYCFLSLASGVSLEVILRAFSSMKESLETANQASVLRRFLPTIQTIHHFMGFSEDPLMSKGDLIDFDDYQRKGTFAIICNVKCQRMMLGFFFGDLVLAERHMLSLDEIAQVPPTFEKVTYTFYVGLVAVAIARREGRGSIYRKYVHEAESVQKRLKMLCQFSADNCLGMFYLVKAEIASLAGQKVKALKAYMCAAALAFEKHNLFMHALSKELLARHLLRNNKGHSEDGRQQMEDAIGSYRKWGGFAKVNRLRSEMVSRYGQEPGSGGQNTSCPVCGCGNVTNFNCPDLS